jgi:hypothetical protein
MSPGKDGGRPLVQKSGIQHRFGGNPAAKGSSRRLAVSAIGPWIRGGGLHTPDPKLELRAGANGRSCYWLAICACAGWKIPVPEICDAIRNAATTAGRLINLRN